MNTTGLIVFSGLLLFCAVLAKLSAGSTMPGRGRTRYPQPLRTLAEVQSGLDRLRWAEALILQLPADHDGRNSWLMNYGRAEEARRLRAKRGLTFNEQSQAVNPPGRQE
jgi:hypothetical protein